MKNPSQKSMEAAKRIITLILSNENAGVKLDQTKSVALIIDEEVDGTVDGVLRKVASFPRG